jgi:hypothetical protein
MIGTERGTIWKSDSSDWQLLANGWTSKQDSTVVEQVRPFAWILGCGDLPVGFVAQGIRAITQQSALGDLGLVQLLALHGLDWIAA